MKISNLKTKNAIFKPIKTPKNIEIEFYRFLKFMLEQIYKRFENIVIKGIDKKYIKEQVQDENYVNLLENLIKIFNKKIDKQFDLKRIFDIANYITNLTYKYNEIKWSEQLIKFGIDLKENISYKFLSKYLKMRIQSNIILIKSLKDDAKLSLEEMIYRNFEQGKTIKEFSKELENKFGIDKRRATLISRNEIKNTNTQLNKKRMQEYGIEYAIWETSEDERVRAQHKYFQGKKYQIGIGLKNEKGENEEPGEAINCRCIAIPVI